MSNVKLVNIVWDESGRPTKIICEIVGEDDTFLIVRTLKRTMKINKKFIIKIEEKIDDENYGTRRSVD